MICAEEEKEDEGRNESRSETRQNWHRLYKAHTHILVVEMTQQLHLAQDALGVDEIGKRIGHLFDGDLLVGVLVGRRAAQKNRKNR